MAGLRYSPNLRRVFTKPQMFSQNLRRFHLFILVLLLCHQSLLTPVFEHLEDGVARYACPLHGDALLQGLFKAEALSQPLKDAVVLSPLAPVA